MNKPKVSVEDYINTILTWVFGFLSMVVIGSLTNIAGYLFTQDLARKCTCLWCKLLLWFTGVKVIFIGQDYLDPDNTQILVANHGSIFDIFALFLLTIKFCCMVKEELFKIWIFGGGMRCAGFISVDRKNKRQAIKDMAQALKRIKEGLSLMIFPEGARSLSGKLEKFHPGAFYLAIKAQVPVVPASIWGDKLMRKGDRWLYLPQTIYIEIHSPFPTQGLRCDKDTIENLAKQVRKIISGGVEQLKLKSIR